MLLFIGREIILKGSSVFVKNPPVMRRIPPGFRQGGNRIS